MRIRGFQVADTAVLTQLTNHLLPEHPLSPAAYARYVARLQQNHGRFWVVSDGSGTAVGYAALLPVPGLPRLAELTGGIVASKRRQGYGRFLLRHILQEMPTTPYRQLSANVPRMDSATARFLQGHGFFLEHEEWTLIKEQLAMSNEQPTLANCSLLIVDLETAVATFLTLYDQTFAPHPWYQPYTSTEVKALLNSSTDILFLQSAPSNLQPPTPIGFAWLHLNGRVGEIEPIGIVPAWQGKGYGRFLLHAALHQLAQRGATSAQITAWRSNKTAVRLYQNLGFCHHQTHTYLAYNLE